MKKNIFAVIILLSGLGLFSQGIAKHGDINEPEPEQSCQVLKNGDISNDRELKKVEILPENVTGFAGDTIYVDVVATGFNMDTTTLVAIEYYIDFNNQVAEYVGVSNFSELMPQNQWFYSAPSDSLSRFACNWAQPVLQNISVPDGEVVMTLAFVLHDDSFDATTTLDFDEQFCLFVHIDENFATIELEVEYFNCEISVPVSISDNESSKFEWLSQSNDVIYISGLNGIARVFNTRGQLVLQKSIFGDPASISIHEPGIYIINVVTENRKVYSKKVYVH